MLQHGARGRAVNGALTELEEQVRRLSEEVARLSCRIKGLALPLGPDRREAMTSHLVRQVPYSPEGLGSLRHPETPLPEPCLVHRLIRQRELRWRYFERELFADPAWDILLGLTAARAEDRRVSVTSLCIAAAVPATTALRWISHMTAKGILIREPDADDRRRAFIALSDQTARAMARYFEGLARQPVELAC